MDSMDAKSELLTNHFTHSLQQLVDHLTEAGDLDTLVDIRRIVDATVDDALERTRPGVRLTQRVELDPESRRQMIG